MITILSVIICTHNPKLDYLDRVLNALKAQTLPKEQWELLLIDNASLNPLDSAIDINWHPRSRHVREETLGLTAARLRGFREAVSDNFVFVDDDNVLDFNYLNHVVKILQKFPEVGAIGGKSLPEFEVEPALWIEEFWSCLALRDFGEIEQVYTYSLEIGEKHFPYFSPIGAGLALRRKAAEIYVQELAQDSSRLRLGRTGKTLTSGEDNDVVLTLLSAGWGVGYFPQLCLTHLISSNRLSPKYLAQLNYASSRSWIQVLDTHGIRPWQKIAPWTVPLRKLKTLLQYQPWKNPTAYIKWQGACGLFEGLSTLSNS